MPSKKQPLLDVNCRIVLLIFTTSLLVHGGRHKRCNRRCQRICAGVPVLKHLQYHAYYHHCLHQRMAYPNMPTNSKIEAFR